MSTHIPTGPGRWWSDEELAEHDAALVAERNAARDQLEALVEAGVADRIGGRYEVSGVLDAAREQLAEVMAGRAEVDHSEIVARDAEIERLTAEAAASQAIIEQALEEGSNLGDAPAARMRAVLAAAPSAALTTDRAQRWVEGWQQGFRDYQARQYDSEGHAVITPTPNPYRVTPSTELNHTEEPPC